MRDHRLSHCVEGRGGEEEGRDERETTIGVGRSEELIGRVKS
jgi:hypothetical protein